MLSVVQIWGENIVQFFYWPGSGKRSREGSGKRPSEGSGKRLREEITWQAARGWFGLFPLSAMWSPLAASFHSSHGFFPLPFRSLFAHLLRSLSTPLSTLGLCPLLSSRSLFPLPSHCLFPLPLPWPLSTPLPRPLCTRSMSNEADTVWCEMKPKEAHTIWDPNEADTVWHQMRQILFDVK